jgi:hypothetical protein
MSKLARVYVAPGCEARASGLLAARRLICLRGAEGSGRESLAIQLLRQHVSDEVWQIRPHTSVAEVSAASLERERGFFLSMSQGDAPAEFDLALLRSACEERKCYLVLIAGADQAGFFADVPVVTVAPPDADRVSLLRGHVTYRIGEPRPGDHDQMEAALAGPAVLGWCQGTHRLAEIDTVASIITDVVAGRVDMDALADNLSLASQDGIKAWFENPEHAPLRPLKITLSFFGGMPLKTVLELENRLTVMLREEAGETGTRDLFAVSSGARLADSSAHVGFADHDDSYGAIRTQVVEFADRTRQANLAQLLRATYPQARSVLVAWLRECTGHPDSHVQRRAALMLGSFAEDNLPLLVRDVIGPWARLPAAHTRQLVVWALAAPLARPDTAPRVTRMLAEWANSDDRNVAATAAMAYGLALGPANPRVALSGLARIARRQESPDDDWATSAALGVTAMYMSNLSDLTGEVLGTLRKWVRSKKKTERELALLTFVLIAKTVDDVVQNGAAPGAGPGTLPGAGKPRQHKRQVWPSLLVVAMRTPARADIIVLWRIALGHPEWSAAALAALRYWFGCANDRPYLVRPLTEFIFALATTYEEADRLAHHLHSWARKNPKGAAAQVYRSLTGPPAENTPPGPAEKVADGGRSG